MRNSGRYKEQKKVLGKKGEFQAREKKWRLFQLKVINTDLRYRKT